MHEAGGQLVVVVEGAPLVHPSPEDAFVDAQALTPSIDEGVQPKIKTAPRRASPTRFVVDSSSTPTLYGLQLIQGPMEGVVVILGQNALHNSWFLLLLLLHLFFSKQCLSRVWVTTFITQRKKTSRHREPIGTRTRCG